MSFACVNGCTNNLSSLKLHSSIELESVWHFYLPLSVAFLFFWGRSISISPTSTSITFHSHPGWYSCRWLGSRNLPHEKQQIFDLTNNAPHCGFVQSPTHPDVKLALDTHAPYSNATSNWSSTLSFVCPPRCPRRSRFGRSTSTISLSSTTTHPT